MHFVKSLKIFDSNLQIVYKADNTLCPRSDLNLNKLYELIPLSYGKDCAFGIYGADLTKANK